MSKSITILLLLIAAVAIGQTKTDPSDSLRAILKSEISDSAKLQTYFQLLPFLKDTAETKSYLPEVFELISNSSEPDNAYSTMIRIVNRLRQYNNIHTRKVILDRFMRSASMIEDLSTRGYFYYELSALQSQIGRRELFDHYVAQSETLFRQAQDSLGIARCFAARAASEIVQARWLDALEPCARSIELFLALRDTTSAVIMRYNIVDIYMKMDNYKEAINQLEISRDHAEKSGNQGMLTLILNKLASIYSTQGKYDIAKNYLEKSLKISLEIGQPAATAGAYISLGDIAADNDLDSTAISYYHKSLAIYQELGEQRGIQRRLSKIGYLHLRRNREDSAMIYYDKAFKIALAGDFNYDYIEEVERIGEWYAAQGKPTKALDFYFRGVSKSEEVENSTALARFYLRIAKTYQVQQNDSLTNQYFDMSMALNEQIGNAAGLAAVKTTKAKMLLERADYEQALQLSLEAAALTSNLGDSCKTSDTYLIIGNLYRQLHKEDSSFYYLTKARAAAEKCRLPQYLAPVKVSLGNLYEQKNQVADAIRLYEEAMTIANKEHLSQVIIDASSRLHVIYRKQGNLQKAYENLQAYQTNKDIVFNAETTRELTRKEMQYKYEKEKAVQELTLQNVRVAQQQKLQGLRWLTFTSIGAFLAMVLIALAFYRNFKNKKKANILLSQQNEAIEQQKQRLQELDQSKSRFFANISHELRTPLTLISGPLETLSEHKTYDENSTQIALRNTRKLKGLVDDILDLSKLESFKIKLNIAPVKISEFINRISSNYESITRRLEIDYQVAIDDAISEWLQLDAGRLEKIINNLLSNAIKHTPSGGRVAPILTRNDDSLQIQVMDTGQGIPEEDLPHIFERYFQSKQPEAPIQGGTGIGLSLANELAIIMDGELTVESEVGKGSSFTCLLPYKIAVDPGVKAEDFAVLDEDFNKDPEEAEQLSINTDPENKPQILYVEDNLDMQEYTSRLLADSYEVTTAVNGYKALELLNSQSFHLVITDAMMPEMDGYTLIEHMRETDHLRMTPVVMLTALNFEDSKLKALAIGVDDYLTKPFSAMELIARVQNLIARAEVRQSWIAEVAQQSSEVTTENQTLPSAEEPMTIRQSDMDWLRQVESHIWKEIENSEFNITILADQYHLSRRQFQRRIKKLTGMSPKQYQHEISLQKGRQLLETSAYANVTAIAYASGIRNPSRFAQMYYQRFGKKPSDYFKENIEV